MPISSAILSNGRIDDDNPGKSADVPELAITLKMVSKYTLTRLEGRRVYPEICEYFVHW